MYVSVLTQLESRGPATAMEFSFKLAELLTDKHVVDKMKKAMIVAW